jgi:phosphoglycerate dehydrogenase-like enzyme
MRVLICSELFPIARPMLQARLPHDEVLTCPGDAVLTALPGVDVVIPAMARVDGAAMDAGRFRLIQQWGAGLEGVDLAAARARGIWVANVPSGATGNATAVAELALLLILALLRRLPEAQAGVRAGVLGAPLGRSLAGSTVCLVGVGGVGSALARRLQPFGVDVVGVGRRPAGAHLAELGLSRYYRLGELPEALALADVVVLCVPVAPETRGLIDAAALACLKPSAYLVNVARGPLIDYQALRDALAERRLAGVALDVFWEEPIPPDDPLLAYNVIATPHIGGVTDHAYAGIADAVAANVERLRRGEPPLHRAV